mmetsp:Transcript_11914/g.25069  ORF Transcript_11914/g.25069 Transcript_11914/m.25069 type:complete len:219 (-) Transcript_11914:115-771(-)
MVLRISPGGGSNGSQPQLASRTQGVEGLLVTLRFEELDHLRILPTTQTNDVTKDSAIHVPIANWFSTTVSDRPYQLQHFCEGAHSLHKGADFLEVLRRRTLQSGGDAVEGRRCLEEKVIVVRPQLLVDNIRPRGFRIAHEERVLQVVLESAHLVHCVRGQVRNRREGHQVDDQRHDHQDDNDYVQHVARLAPRPRTRVLHVLVHLYVDIGVLNNDCWQ